MLDTLTLPAVLTQSTQFFAEISTPVFWLVGIPIALSIASWVIAKVRRR